MNRFILPSLLAAGLLGSALFTACESAPTPVAKPESINSHEDFQNMGANPTVQPTPSGAATPVAMYGVSLKKTDADATPVKDVLAKPADYTGKNVRLNGKVVAVCEKKGCWLTVGDPSTFNTVYVKFMDPPAGRLVPMEAKGHDVTVEGTLVEVNVSEAQARHLAEDAGATDEQVNKIVGVQKMLFIKNPGVKITGVAPATQPAPGTPE